jgi:hypothetical protein
MKIKLIRTGGFIAITREAEAEVTRTEQEISRLLETIQSGPSVRRVKDGHYYELNVGNVTTPIDLEKVPEEYKSLFEKLKRDLQIVKL